MEHMKDNEALLLQIFRSLDTQGQMNIITTCMNERAACAARKQNTKPARRANGNVIMLNTWKGAVCK